MGKDFVDKIEPTRPWPPAPLPGENQKKQDKGQRNDQDKTPIGDRQAQRLPIKS